MLYIVVVIHRYKHQLKDDYAEVVEASTDKDHARKWLEWCIANPKSYNHNPKRYTVTFHIHEVSCWFDHFNRAIQPK